MLSWVQSAYNIILVQFLLTNCYTNDYNKKFVTCGVIWWVGCPYHTILLHNCTFTVIYFWNLKSYPYYYIDKNCISMFKKSPLPQLVHFVKFIFIIVLGGHDYLAKKSIRLLRIFFANILLLIVLLVTIIMF